MNFGISVAIDGNSVAVGGPGSRKSYIFTRTDNSWVKQAEIFPPGSQEPGMFGQSVDIDENTLVVGAPRDNPSSLIGAVFVYERSGSTWIFSTKLERDGYTCCRLLGQEVALEGDTLMAGAADNAAFLYNREGATWSGPSAFTMGAGINFGMVVATDDGKIYVGANSADLPGAINAGVAYGFNVIPATDLVVAMVDSTDAVKVGASLSYAVGVLNGGPDRATNVEWIVNLPTDYHFVSMDAPQELGCVHNAGVITCLIDSLDYDEIIIFEIHGLAGYDDGIISANTSATGDLFDPYLANNFTVETTTASAFLNAPINLIPVDNAVFEGERPTFSWKPIPSATGYVVEVGDRLPLMDSQIVYSGSNTRFTLANPLLPRTYYWRVRAYSGVGPSAWSIIVSFEVVSAVNSAPRRSYFTSHDVTLSWGTLTGITQQYQVEIANNVGIVNPSVRATVNGNSETFTIARNGVYYWRVRVLPNGAWSPVEQFTVDAP